LTFRIYEKFPSEDVPKKYATFYILKRWSKIQFLYSYMFRWKAERL